MITFTKEKVLYLHNMMANATGGSVGLRDEGLLESALYSVNAGFGGEEFYKTIEEKAAHLGFSLISNHAFVDGNKRIGVFVMLTFLEVMGVNMTCTNDDVIKLGLGVADGSMKYDKILDWIKKHSN